VLRILRFHRTILNYFNKTRFATSINLIDILRRILVIILAIIEFGEK
jgi:hypothetical protein